MLSTSTGSFGFECLISRKTSRPLRPGMVMSSTTTSHLSFHTRLSASWALRASPNSARRNSSASTCRKPWRTTVWSSTMSIFMAFFRWRGLAGWNPNGDGRAFAGHAVDRDLTAQQRRALAHPAQAEGPGAGDFRLRDPAAVVAHLENDAAGFLFQLHLHPRRAGVADDVGEGFLKNPKEGRVQLGAQHGFLGDARPRHALDASAGLKVVCLPFNRRDPAQIIEDARTQLGGNAPQGLDDRVNARHERFDFPGVRPGHADLLVAEPRKVQFQTRQRLAPFVKIGRAH